MPRPIVMIHGMWCTGADFNRMAGLLRARGHACHAPSLPAHERGVPHPEVGNKSLREYLSFLETFIQGQAFAEPPVLIGHSMGALLAQQLAARGLASALVLLTPAAPASVSALTWAALVSFFPATARPGFWKRPHKPSARWASLRAFNGVPAEQHAGLYAGLVEESGRVLVESGFPALDRERSAALDPAAVKCPVYVVSCGADRLISPGLVRKVAALYPGSALRHYPHRGHWVLDDPDTDEMTTDIANWLQGQERRAAGLAREKE